MRLFLSMTIYTTIPPLESKEVVLFYREKSEQCYLPGGLVVVSVCYTLQGRTGWVLALMYGQGTQICCKIIIITITYSKRRKKEKK